MSDPATEATSTETAESTEPAQTPNIIPEAEEEPLTRNDALQIIIRASFRKGFLRRGLHEVVKVLDRGEAVFCVLADDVDKPKYKQLIQALCKQHNIPLLTLDTREALGKMCGLIKFKAKDGSLKRVVQTGCVAVTKWYSTTDVQARSVVKEWISDLNGK